MSNRDVAATFIRWTCMRAAFHRGWWLVTSLYLVIEADLSAFQLVFIGTAQSLTALAFEVPTGVMADTISRKGSVVIAHLVMGTGMLVTGLVTAFPALVGTQMLWGLAWTFSSGADVAWLTDELDQPERVPGVLTAAARWDQVGAACGMVAFGGLAWATDLATSIVVSGLAMLALGLFVVARFPERHFIPTRKRRWRESASIFRRGVDLARRDREILLVFAATILINGAGDAFGRLFPKRLIELGLPEKPDPIVWLTALGLVTLALGALALRVLEARMDDVGVGRRVYAAACFIGALGLAILALAPDDLTAMAGVLLVGGISWTVTRCVSVIWINRRATSDVRATVQSFLAQAEYLGEIFFGIGLGVLAQATSIAVAMLGACALVAAAGVLVVRSRGGDAPIDEIQPRRGPRRRT
jgi:MFS transporter, DHA3 family, tetracycline resistance protein